MIRFAAPAVTALALLAGQAQATDLTAMSDADRAAFRAEVRQYLLENPEVIMEAVSVLEQRQADAAAVADQDMIAANHDAIFNDGYSWVGGNPDGDITLVEFMDYRCGYCRKAVPEVTELLETDGNIRLVIKEFPILGEASVLASRFAISTRLAAGPEAYADVHDALVAMKGEISTITLGRLAEGLGLDAETILEGMNGEEVNRELRLNHQLAQALKISGTPTFVLQDELLRGYLPAKEMARIVAEKREEG